MNAPPRGAGDVGTELSIYVRSPNEARTALAFGIDRIILDTHRTRVGTSSKFDLHSLEWAFNLARRLGKKATVWFDREPREREEGDIVEVANSLERIGFSSAIVKDPMSVSILKEKSIRETVLDPIRPVPTPRMRMRRRFRRGRCKPRWCSHRGRPSHRRLPAHRRRCCS